MSSSPTDAARATLAWRAGVAGASTAPGPIALSAAAGIAAAVMPLAAPYAVLALLAAFCGLALSVGRGCSPPWTMVPCGAVAAAALGGWLSHPCAGALIAAMALSGSSPAGRAAALIVLALQLSYTPTVEAYLSDTLASGGLEAAAPALVAAGAFAVAFHQRWFVCVGAAAAALAISWLGRRAGLPPAAELAAAGIPALVTGAALAASGKARGAVGMAGALCGAMFAVWAATPPRLGHPRDVHLILPDAPDAPEARFFRGYAAALRFAGLRVVEVAGPEAVPKGAVVFLPWASAPFAEREGDHAARFRTLADERRWTVVLAGEHTGYGGIDVRAAALAGRPLLRRDLTVPPGNADTSGPLRAADLSAWPAGAVLNRGSTVGPVGPLDRVLLAGDGWWAEPDIGEWLWVGDFRWRPGDRGGRLPLAAAFAAGGARWVVLGDSSPVVNRQVVADPRPLLRILHLATLTPSFALDTVLLLSALAVMLQAAPGMRTAVTGLAAVSLAWATATPPAGLLPSEAWRRTYLGEGGFEDSNFNLALASEPRLLSAGWAIERRASPVGGDLPPAAQPMVSFLLVDGALRAGGAALSNCWRLGSMAAGETGPRLMDAQACRIDGDAEPLVGTREAAAVVRVLSGAAPRILVLDRGFLAANAPEGNRAWLLRMMGSSDGQGD